MPEHGRMISPIIISLVLSFAVKDIPGGVRFPQVCRIVCLTPILT